jgi:hypothetical protein
MIRLKTGLLVAVLISTASAMFVYCGSMGDGQVVPFSGLFWDQMRFQTLFTKTQLGISGTITQIAFRVQADVDPPGLYHNGRITLCHTDLNALSANFNNNYGGFTPVDTLTGAEIFIPGLANSWVTLDLTTPFNYSASHNLIVELRWFTDNGNDVPIWAWDPASGFRRVWASAIDATVGEPANYAYYMRFMIGGEPVEPTSLGMIKATFTK